MTTCYLCTVHGAPSADPSAIGCCSTCGVFTCIYDGARVHGKGEFRCAICLVRVLLHSAGVLDPLQDPGGGGGISSALAEARAREFLGTEDFEHECAQLAASSEMYRYGWRNWLAAAQVSADAAREFGERLDILGGAGIEVADRVQEGLATGTVDRGLLADAAGVGEYGLRLSESGPMTLASVARERAEAEQADARAAEAAAAHQRAALETALLEKSSPERAGTIIGAKVEEPAKQEEVNLKYKTMGK